MGAAAGGQTSCTHDGLSEYMAIGLSHVHQGKARNAKKGFLLRQRSALGDALSGSNLLQDRVNRPLVHPTMWVAEAVGIKVAVCNDTTEWPEVLSSGRRHRGKRSVGEFARLLSLGSRPVREGPGTHLGALSELSSALTPLATTCDHFADQWPRPPRKCTPGLHRNAT